MIKLGQHWHGNEGKFALKSAGKWYFYMLKMQKVPIPHPPPLGRFAPSDDDASRHRILHTDFLFSKVGRYDFG